MTQIQTLWNSLPQLASLVKKKKKKLHGSLLLPWSLFLHIMASAPAKHSLSAKVAAATSGSSEANLDSRGTRSRWLSRLQPQPPGEREEAELMSLCGLCWGSKFSVCRVGVTRKGEMRRQTAAGTHRRFDFSEEPRKEKEGRECSGGRDPKHVNTAWVGRESEETRAASASHFSLFMSQIQKKRKKNCGDLPQLRSKQFSCDRREFSLISDTRQRTANSCRQFVPSGSALHNWVGDVALPNVTPLHLPPVGGHSCVVRIPPLKSTGNICSLWNQERMLENSRGGKSIYILFLSKSPDTCVKKNKKT